MPHAKAFLYHNGRARATPIVPCGKPATPGGLTCRSAALTWPDAQNRAASRQVRTVSLVAMITWERAAHCPATRRQGRVRDQPRAALF